MDLISRQAVIDKAIMIPVGMVVTEDKVIWRKAVFVEDIEALPSVGGWIPCNEKIPEKAVLCCNVHGEIIIGCIYEDNGSDSGYTAINDDVCMSECVAWMPLPKPYREEDADE